MDNKCIIKPFNLTYVLFALIYGAVLAIYITYFKKYSMAEKEVAAIVFYLLDWLVFILYKISISKDEELASICYQNGFNWLNELPLNTCNIVLFLVPLGIIFKSRVMLATCFYSSLIVTPLALLMPCRGFEKYSLFKPRIFGFYLTHYMTLSAGIILICFGIFFPSPSDVILAAIGMLVTLTIVYLINKVMRASGINPYANYFYCMDPDGNPALELLKKLIPCEYLYCLPLVVIFGILSYLLTIVINMLFWSLIC